MPPDDSQKPPGDGEVLRILAAQVAALTDQVERLSTQLETSGLPSQYEHGTMTRTKMTSSQFEKLPGEERRRLGIAMARGSKHPFPSALYKDGKTVTDWAAEKKLDRNIVKSWFAKGKAVRPIPRRLATEIARKYPSVPATPEIWRGGLKD